MGVSFDLREEIWAERKGRNLVKLLESAFSNGRLLSSRHVAPSWNRVLKVLADSGGSVYTHLCDRLGISKGQHLSW